ncbi:unnamed protein product [Protopolystoma xenopodis]|uniref:Aminotransferase class V domain-containing protein n=1 Tax=Protopolystoma xenopodis TaxID=117903 RepID=A0A3S5FFE8_9PLAT|nr:unnamed protein product [Protopolystoma xenopodis]
MAWRHLSDCPNLIILGGTQSPRLPIISFVVRHVYKSSTSPDTAVRFFPPRQQDIRLTEPESFPVAEGGEASCKTFEHVYFLHHNFVATLLNDMFGVQARAGCACAGPYAMDLLGIDEQLAQLYEEALVGWLVSN